MVNPQNIGMGILSAFQMGRQDGEQRRYRSALGSYAADPNEQNLAGLAAYNPEFVIEERGRLQQQSQQQAIAQLQQRAASGDRAAMAQLAGVDLDAYDKLADNDRQNVAERVKTIGNAGMYIASLPEEQQPAAWDAAIDQLAPAYPELAEYKGRYSPDALRGVISQAGMMQDFLKSQMPDYMAIPEGGTLVNTRDPAAVASVGNGAPAGGPTPGAVVNGYVFKGGNPNDRNSWAPAGGGGGNVTDNFPGL